MLIYKILFKNISDSFDTKNSFNKILFRADFGQS